MKYIYLFSLLVLVGCSINSNKSNQARLHEKLSPLVFTSTHSISGDFNGDGLLDEATIIQYTGRFQVSKSINEKQFWTKGQSNNEVEQALIIVLGVTNVNNKMYALHYGFSRFNTPSFSLFAMTPDDKSVVELTADGNVIGIPSEAGIDEFVFFKNNELLFYSPEEIP